MTGELQTPVPPPLEWLPWIIVCAMVMLAASVGLAAWMEWLP